MIDFKSYSHMVLLGLMLVVTATLANVVCPGGEKICVDYATCCPMQMQPELVWGCCNITNAVCCPNGKHCCAPSLKCDGDQCVPKTSRNNVPITLLPKKDVVCPGGQSSCPSDSTCCSVGGQKYACCPLPNATCCSDNLHCCPENTACNLSEGTCITRGAFVPKLEIMKSSKVKKVKSTDVPCGSGKESCPDGSSCCKTPNGEWGCCPLVDAVCCDDHVHCCPSGMKCEKGGCQEAGEPRPMFQLQSLASKIKNLGVVVCPDGESQCPDDNTCCELTTGEWGCCPLPDAVCCDDKEHCCPEGTQCSQGRCLSSNIQTPLYKKVKSTPRVRNVVCPGEEYQCPDQNTCCKLRTGEWGCCPLPEAVCCDDMEHCCPSGTTCKAGECQRSGRSIPWYTKTKAKSMPIY